MRNWWTSAVDKVWFGKSWTPWLRAVVPLVLVLAVLLVLVVFFAQTMGYVLGGVAAAASGVRYWRSRCR